MSTIVKRGYVPEDEKEFSTEYVKILCKAELNLLYLINRGYPIKGSSTFVGNHYLLSERQRLALVRAISTDENIKLRASTEVKSIP